MFVKGDRVRFQSRASRVKGDWEFGEVVRQQDDSLGAPAYVISCDEGGMALVAEGDLQTVGSLNV